MRELAVSSVFVLGSGLFTLAPGALVALWHMFIWLASVGLFLHLIEEYGDLDAGIVAAAMFCLMLTGIGLSLICGLGWTYSLALALPLLSTTGILLARSEQL